jgi:hypothetical protein
MSNEQLTMNNGKRAMGNKQGRERGAMRQEDMSMGDSGELVTGK